MDNTEVINDNKYQSCDTNGEPFICRKCCFHDDYEGCRTLTPCTPKMRDDGRDVYFIKVKTE